MSEVENYCPCCGSDEPHWNGAHADLSYVDRDNELDSLRARVAELEGLLRDCAWHSTVDRLNARVAELEGLLRECSDDLAAEIEHRYDRVKDHPAMTPKYERDMDIVVRAHALLDNEDTAAGC